MATVVTFGELLLRLTPPEGALLGQANAMNIFVGGAEANVAIGLSHLGVDTSMISAVPPNDLGELAVSELSRQGVSINHVQRRDGRMGLYFMEQGTSIRPSRVIYDRAGSSFALGEKGSVNWKKALENARCLHVSGITPAISQGAADLTLEAVQTATAQGIQVSVDLNYRKNLWKYGKHPRGIMPDIVRQANVLIGDPATINLMLGTTVKTLEYYTSHEDLLDSYDQLLQAFPNLQYMGMTLRESESASSNVVGGALYHDGKVYGAEKILVSPVVERVGSGDAFMSGVLYGLLKKKPLLEVVNFAATCAALKLTISGDYNLFSAKRIEELMKEGTSGKIQR